MYTKMLHNLGHRDALVTGCIGYRDIFGEARGLNFIGIRKYPESRPCVVKVPSRQETGGN